MLREYVRDASGQFAETGESRRAAEKIAKESTAGERAQISRLSTSRARELQKKALAQGGLTYDMVNDAFPEKGFAVSIHPEQEEVVKGVLPDDTLERYANEHAAFMEKNPGANVGIWYDAAADKWYFDVTHVEPDRDRAIELGKAHNQEGIYDLEKGETIIVKDADKRRL